ncbi:MAG TPA: tyrosine-type recombinase/integrase, partial [Ktedonobacteraceae bacterium]
DAKSGTEHEFRKAYQSWKRNGYPQIMVYFNQSCYTLTSKEEVDQLGQVLEFKQNFPREGLFWTYKGEDEFINIGRNHLSQYILKVTVPDSKTLDSESITKKPARTSPPLDEQVSLWMQARASKRTSTEKTYAFVMNDFREALQEQGLDLNSQDASAILSLITKWADTNVDGSKVAPNTYNHKVYIISSYYGYAVTQGWIETNPLETVEKREIVLVNEAKAVEFEKVKAGLKKIPRNTLPGKRDYALLCVLLTCGLHVSELVGLRCGDICIIDGEITIKYQQKGGIKGEQTLRQATAQALIDYLTMLYSNGYSAGDPVWLSFARNDSKGQPITKPGVSDILKKYLGTSKVESTRLTYHAMKEEVGLTGIEKLLDLI